MKRYSVNNHGHLTEHPHGKYVLYTGNDDPNDSKYNLLNEDYKKLVVEMAADKVYRKQLEDKIRQLEDTPSILEQINKLSNIENPDNDFRSATKCKAILASIHELTKG